eukprot:362865-Chlamydomonas_euryale.AAC.3
MEQGPQPDWAPGRPHSLCGAGQSSRKCSCMRGSQSEGRYMSRAAWAERLFRAFPGNMTRYMDGDWRERFHLDADEDRLRNLAEALAQPPNRRIDLRLNRLPLECLCKLVSVLRTNPGTRMCVGLNGFSFSAFYNQLKAMDALYLHETERITYGWEDREIDVERLAAKELREDKVITLAQAIEALRLAHNEQFQARQKENNDHQAVFTAFKKGVSDTSTTVQAFKDSVTGLVGWQKRQTDAFEVLVTGVVRKWLSQTADFVEDLPRKHLIIPVVEPTDRAVEWDGALCSVSGDGRRTIYLIEAKTSLQSSDISDMQDRISMSIKFFETLVNEPKWPSKSGKRSWVLERCNAWRKFVTGADMLPVGVIAGHDLDEEMREKTRGLNYIYVHVSDQAFKVVDANKEISVDAPTEDELDAQCDDRKPGFDIVNVRTVVADDGLWRRSLIDSEFDLDLQGRSRLQWGVRVFRKWVFRSRLFLWKVIGCVNRAQREHFQRVLEIFRRTGGFQEAEKEVVGCVELPEGVVAAHHSNNALTGCLQRMASETMSFVERRAWAGLGGRKALLSPPAPLAPHADEPRHVAAHVLRLWVTASACGLAFSACFQPLYSPVGIPEVQLLGHWRLPALRPHASSTLRRRTNCLLYTSDAADDTPC